MTTWAKTAAAAAHINRDPHEVRRLAFDQSTGKRCPTGLIPGYKVRGQWRFDVAQLDAWMRGTTDGPRRITTRK